MITDLIDVHAPAIDVQGLVKTFGENLSELGRDYSSLQVPAAHDWECWQLVFANAAENFLWK